MELPDRDEAKSWKGLTVVDRDGQHLGTCGGVFADTDTGVPEWLDVDVQGHGRSFVPALDVVELEGQVRVRFARDLVVSTPPVGDSEQLSKHDEMRLYDHYGVEYDASESDSLLPAEAHLGDADDMNDTALHGSPVTTTASSPDLTSVRAEPAPVSPVDVTPVVVTPSEESVQQGGPLLPPAPVPDVPAASSPAPAPTPPPFSPAPAPPAADKSALAKAGPAGAVGLAVVAALVLRRRGKASRTKTLPTLPTVRADRLAARLQSGGSTAARVGSRSATLATRQASKLAGQATDTVSSLSDRATQSGRKMPGSKTSATGKVADRVRSAPSAGATLKGLTPRKSASAKLRGSVPSSGKGGGRSTLISKVLGRKAPRRSGIGSLFSASVRDTKRSSSPSLPSALRRSGTPAGGALRSMASLARLAQRGRKAVPSTASLPSVTPKRSKLSSLPSVTPRRSKLSALTSVTGQITRRKSSPVTDATNELSKNTRKATRTLRKGSAKVADRGTDVTGSVTGSATGLIKRLVPRRRSKATRAVSGAGTAVAKRGRKTRRSIARTFWKYLTLAGAGVGYLLGARAGRPRYEQISSAAVSLGSQPPVRRVLDTAKDPQLRQQAITAARRQSSALVTRVRGRSAT